MNLIIRCSILLGAYSVSSSFSFKSNTQIYNLKVQEWSSSLLSLSLSLRCFGYLWLFSVSHRWWSGYCVYVFMHILYTYSVLHKLWPPHFFSYPEAKTWRGSLMWSKFTCFLSGKTGARNCGLTHNSIDSYLRFLQWPYHFYPEIVRQMVCKTILFSQDWIPTSSPGHESNNEVKYLWHD